jgi:hypothetical protein
MLLFILYTVYKIIHTPLCILECVQTIFRAMRHQVWAERVSGIPDPSISHLNFLQLLPAALCAYALIATKFVQDAHGRTQTALHICKQNQNISNTDQAHFPCSSVA